MKTVITADGKTVKPGDRVFNYYDGKWGTILDDIDTQGWFTHLADDGDCRCLNGERVAIVLTRGNPYYAKWEAGR